MMIPETLLRVNEPHIVHETIDGETFATGIISYETPTILGQKSMQAKALIKNGSIQKWTYAKSGIEIK